MNLMNKKIMVAYFSRKGQNYSNGAIVELKQGNTALAADMISKAANAELFEIQTVKGYPFEYNACTVEAKKELGANSRPELLADVDVSEYDVIILGYPNWWGTMPMAVWTFLDNHDFTGKEIMPFCTHEGSGMGNSENDLKKLIPEAYVKNGLAIHGSSVKDSRDKITEWLQKA